MTVVALGLLDVSAVLTNSNTESSRQHYLLSPPIGQACRSSAISHLPERCVSLVPLRLAPSYCGSYPGVGHHAHPAAWHAGLRPTSDCPGPCSPSNVCLGCRSL